MTMYHSIIGRTPGRTLSVTYSDGDIATVPESHESFEQLLNLINSGAEEDEVRNLIDIILGAGKRLTQLSERVSFKGRTLFFDGDPIDGALVDTIIELVAAGTDDEKLHSVVNFLEKVKTNPNITTIDGLYKWITNGDLVIHPDGDFIAYKGCQGKGDQRTSQSFGTAFVDGEEITGYIPNPDGAVVSMPRSTVDDGSYNMCSTGLHIATHGFAQGFAHGEVILVKVNPRDVVSVPSDESFKKLRVCRYKVLHAVAGRLDGRVYVQPELEPETEDQTPEEFKAAAEEVIDEETWNAAHDAVGDTPFTVTPADEDNDEEIAEIEDLLKPVHEYGTVDAEEPEKAPEEPQEPLRESNGRFTKAGAAHEAKAALRDALGRFIKNK
jgi:hypothetical protein